MKVLLRLFTSTSGRISRQIWWLGATVLFLLNWVANRLLGLILRYEAVPMKDIGATQGPTEFTVSLSWVTDDSRWRHGLASLGWSVVLSGLAWCLCVKRRHDRDANGWEVALALAIPILVSLIDLTRDVFRTAPLPFPDEYSIGASFLVTYLYASFVLYVLVLLGLLKGTPGPNQYGPQQPVSPANAQESP